jgi:DNA repair protein RadC
MRRALELNAGRLILIHNHPSGTLKPSPAAKKITTTLATTARPLGIKITDHLIIADQTFKSII